MDTIGKQIFKERKLGEGGYGDVYLCTDEHKRKFAYKKLENGRSGIESPLEPVILSSLTHPSLVKAIHITMRNKELCIFMPLALCDASTYVKVYGVLNDVARKQFAYSLIQAVACLHSNNIIHGDIKCGNILFYPDFPSSSTLEEEEEKHRSYIEAKLSDRKVPALLPPQGKWKVTDFSHSVMYYPGFENYQKIVSTRHYRPVETFNEGWTPALDIWCYGCTVYEMAYGKALIAHQLTAEERKLKSKDKRPLEDTFKLRHFNALIDWIGMWNSINSSARIDSHLKKDSSVMQQQPLNVVAELWSNSEFTNFLRQTLNPLAKNRPLASQLVEHYYFDEIKPLGQRSARVRYEVIPGDKLKEAKSKVRNQLKSVKLPDAVKTALTEVAVKVYCQPYEIDSKLRAEFSVWFADKLMRRNKTETKNEYLMAEEQMATNTPWLLLFS